MLEAYNWHQLSSTKQFGKTKLTQSIHIHMIHCSPLQCWKLQFCKMMPYCIQIFKFVQDKTIQCSYNAYLLTLQMQQQQKCPQSDAVIC